MASRNDIAAKAGEATKSRQASHRARKLAGDRADRTNGNATSSWETMSSGGSTASIMAWALVPPNPNPLMPARMIGAVQGVVSDTGRNGPVSKSINGFVWARFKVGTMVRWRIISSTLATPASPAAASRWPMLVLTDPIRQGSVRLAPWVRASVRAATSIGSPSGVPVPWASM